MKYFPRFLTITGALLIVTAMVAHIICLATPNLVRMDFGTYMKKMNQTIMKMASSSQGEDSKRLQQQADINPGESQSLKNYSTYTHQTSHGTLDTRMRGMFGDGADMHFGIWKMCVKMSIMSSSPMEACFAWGSSFPQDGSLEKPGWIDGVRGCYIAGLVLAILAVIMSNTNVHTPSQGDRRRILPIFICVMSIVAGVVILIGNLIVAFSHNTDFNLPTIGKVEPKVVEAAKKAIESSLEISWGFALDLTSAVVFILAGLFNLLAARAAHTEDKIRRQKDMETPLPNYDVAPL